MASGELDYDWAVANQACLRYIWLSRIERVEEGARGGLINYRISLRYEHTDLSSVGRAEDCSTSQLSLGRWFESGRSDCCFFSSFVLLLVHNFWYMSIEIRIFKYPSSQEIINLKIINLKERRRRYLGCS
jgi:hypothetical protein